MRAAWCTEFGPVSGVVVTDVPRPQPGPGEVAVAVRAAAVNYPDVLIAAGTYQLRPETPFIPGSEFAGEVVQTGENVVRPQLGERVCGATFTGAFAEYVVVPAGALSPVPNELDFVQGAAFRVAYGTAYHALVTIGEAHAGETVVVLGAAGGVGLATVDVAHRLGMRVIAVASTQERLQLALSRGADAGVDYSREPVKERLKALTDGGADVIVDPVGGDLSEQALRATRWGGRFVTVGYASGQIPRIPLNLVLLKGAQIRGFEIRTLPQHAPAAAAAAAIALEGLVADGLRPYVSAVCRLAEVSRAMDDVAQRRALGKVVVVPS